MPSSLAGASLLVLVFLTALTSRAQPPDTKIVPDTNSPRNALVPPLTAFPNLKEPTYERKTAPAPGGGVGEYEERNPIVVPPLPALTDSATQLQKVRHAQAREGLAHLARIKHALLIAGPDPNDFSENLRVLVETYRIAAELEARPVKQVPWYEARVRACKESEHFTLLRVKAGALKPQLFDAICFERLQAEAELLALNTEIARNEKGDAPRMPEPQRPALLEDPLPISETISGKAPAYTAFPNLKEPTVKFVETPNGQKPVEEGRVPLPSLVVIEPNASPLLLLKHERVIAGFTYLARIAAGEAIIGPDPMEYVPDIVFATRVYRAAAELERLPVDRVPWYEARVRKFKEGERYTQLRVQAGAIKPQRLHDIRFQRLQAEVDLLELLAEVAKSGTESQPTKREPLALDKLPRTPEPKPYTAFPALKPLAPRNATAPDEQQRTENDALPKLSAVSADAAILRRVQHERANRGLGYLALVERQSATFGPDPGEFLPSLAMTATAYQAAAELEERPANRVSWYETRIRAFKEIEGATELRVKSGALKPQRLDFVRFERLGVEADLLALNAKLESDRPAFGYAPNPLCQCAPLVGPQVRTRGGLLSRLIHRR